MSRVSQLQLVASSLLVVACTTGDAARKDATSRDAEVPSALLPPCMWTIDACPEHIDWRVDALLDSSELDPDARFIAIGGQAVGVSIGAEESVVRVHMKDEIERFGARFRRYWLPKTVMKLVDVVDNIPGPGAAATVYAFACQQPEAACSLWQVSGDDPDGTVLEEIAGSSFEATASALLFDEDRQQPCLMDKGLYCFDGAWREQIAQSSDGNDLRHVAMGTSMSIAVAARGVYWKRPAAPQGRPAMPWTRERVDAEVTWTGASDIFTGFFLIGERGAFMQNLSTANTLCSHTSDFAASSGSLLVTKQGEVLFGLNEGRCLLQSLGSEAIIDSTTVYCRASQNLLVMTEHSISGTTFCARL